MWKNRDACVCAHKVQTAATENKNRRKRGSFPRFALCRWLGATGRASGTATTCSALRPTILCWLPTTRCQTCPDTRHQRPVLRVTGRHAVRTRPQGADTETRARLGKWPSHNRASCELSAIISLPCPQGTCRSHNNKLSSLPSSAFHSIPSCEWR